MKVSCYKESGLKLIKCTPGLLVLGLVAMLSMRVCAAEQDSCDARTRVDHFDKDWRDWLFALLPAGATFAGIWFACKSAKVDQRISIAPTRTPVYMLFSALSDALASAIAKHEKDALTDKCIREVADDWIYEFGKDDRRKFLEQSGVLNKTSYGGARADFDVIASQVELKLNEGLFYFRNVDIQHGMKNMLETFLFAGSVTSNPLFETDGTDNVEIDLHDADARFRACARGTAEVSELMKSELQIG